MRDKEYREFLRFIFERHIRPHRGRRPWRHYHPMRDDWAYRLNEAEGVSRLLRFIEENCDTEEEIYSTFTAERLSRAISETRTCLHFAKRVIDDAGFAEVYDRFGLEIVAGMRAKHLPQIDYVVLREMGSPNPKLELHGLTYMAKATFERVGHHSEQFGLHDRLTQVEKKLEKALVSFEEAEETPQDDLPKKSRRWFKGLGQIAQGAGLSIANVALAMGTLHLPVSPETQTWGSIVSVVTGVGTIFNGVGELRGE